jgi:2-oxoglutarate ferredoxin oxidoreductase subunit gamma
MVANIIALGTIAALTRVASKKGLLEAVKRRAPKGTEERNLKAVETGFALVQRGRRTRKPK